MGKGGSLVREDDASNRKAWGPIGERELTVEVVAALEVETAAAALVVTAAAPLAVVVARDGKEKVRFVSGLCNEQERREGETHQRQLLQR